MTTYSSTRSPQLFMRPTEAADSMLLFELYAAGRVEMLARSGWATPQQRSFFRRQAQNAEAHFARTHPSAETRTICLDGFSAGRLLVDRSDSGYELLDIAVLPSYRGNGTARRAIQNLVDAAAAQGDKVTVFCCAPKTSTKLSLLENIGFRQRIDEGNRWRLIWR